VDSELIPGVSAFLEKPIEVSTLLETVESLLKEPIQERLRKVTTHLQKSQPVPLF
jgi:FixJ family two-component response regulator